MRLDTAAMLFLAVTLSGGCDGGSDDSQCGNGVLDSGEQCDLGPLNSDVPNSQCRTNCLPQRCGDNIIDGDEQCDEGANNGDGPGSTCTTSCVPAGCGDGVVEAGEDCDLGFANSDAPDGGCRTDCSSQRCGDGIQDSAEGCDLGTRNSDDPNEDCRTNCQPQSCGDGIVDLMELCDDGAANSDLPDAACRPDCQQMRCGDGILDSGEVCDDGNNMSGDGCRYDCQKVEVCGDSVKDSGEGCDDGNTTRWDGCDQCGIVEFGINTYTTDDQNHPQVAMASDGSFVVVWSSFDQDGDSGGIYAQRYGATGTLTGAEFRVNTTTVGNQAAPDVAMAADGRFVVVWTSGSDLDGSGRGVYAQYFDATGSADGTELKVNTTTLYDQFAADVAMTDDGSFVVVWESSAGLGDDLTGIYGQRFDATGIPMGGEIHVNTHTTDSQSNPDVAMASDGRFVVVWESFGQDGTSGYSIVGQRFSAAGAPVDAEFQINTTTDGSLTDASVAMAHDGSFAVVWQQADSVNSVYDVYGQRYTSSGAAAGTEFVLDTTINHYRQQPQIAMDANGAFIVTWIDQALPNTDGNIYIRRFSSTGGAQSAGLRVNHFLSDNQFYPGLTRAATGRYVLVWASELQDGSDWGVYGQRFSAAGTVMGLNL